MPINPDIPNELYYFDDNFSVRSLRKYQLKEILAAHNIPYLSSITRVDLINLFKKNIEPRRDEILREYRRKELEKQQTEDQEEYGRGHRVIHKPVKLEEEFEELPTRPYRRKADTLAESVNKKDSDGFAIPSLPKRDVPKVSQFNAEDSFGEEEVEAIPRQPKFKTPVKERVKKSSTTSVPKRSVASTSKVKKFNPPTFNAEDSFAESEDDEEVQHSSNTPTKRTPQVVAYVGKEIVKEPVNEEDEEDTDYHADGDASDDEDEDIGEVDKEELVLLYKDQSVPPEVFISSEYRGATTRAQKLAAARKNLLIWKAIIWCIIYAFCTLYMIIGAIGLGITTYARNKNGYCQNFPKSVNHTAPSALFSLLPPSCIPCPDHGICTGGELVCDTLYERKTPLYNIGHLFPIADDCVHNSVLGKYVGQVERKIKNQLAIRQGEAACEHFLAHPEHDDSQPVPVARISVKDILADLKSHIQAHVPADKIDEILVIALSAVLEDPKIHYWEIGNQRFLGTDHVKYPFSCQVKRIYKSIPTAVKMYILLFISAASAIYGAFKDYRKNMAYKEKISNLVKSTTDQLKEQYENHTKDPKKYDSPALSVSQLRSSIVDLNDRRTINDWQRVVEQIETHPHIRKSFREVRGDPIEYWELTA